jgi:hypothetical protein
LFVNRIKYLHARNNSALQPLRKKIKKNRRAEKFLRKNLFSLRPTIKTGQNGQLVIFPWKGSPLRKRRALLFFSINNFPACNRNGNRASK